MLILGHVGIGLGIVQLTELAGRKMLGRRALTMSRLTDYRFFAVGALLPDLIDKPLNWLTLPEILNTTRSIGHTLLFPAILLLIALLSWRLGRRGVALSIALGSASHLIFDGMWGTPQTLLWPALGWMFPPEGYLGPSSYSLGLWDNLWQLLWLGSSEILGASIIAELLYRQWRTRRSRRLLPFGLPASDAVTLKNAPVAAEPPDA